MGMIGRFRFLDPTIDCAVYSFYAPIAHLTDRLATVGEIRAQAWKPVDSPLSVHSVSWGARWSMTVVEWDQQVGLRREDEASRRGLEREAEADRDALGMVELQRRRVQPLVLYSTGDQRVAAQGSLRQTTSSAFGLGFC